MFILNNFYRIRIIAALSTPARVAELVDAADSKSAVRKNVLVRFQSRAHNIIRPFSDLKFDEGFLFRGYPKVYSI